jgi:hypothetical protein
MALTDDTTFNTSCVVESAVSKSSSYSTKASAISCTFDTYKDVNIFYNNNIIPLGKYQ